MKKARPAALVAAGPVSSSLLAHLPGLIESLGPIKAQSYRVASRLANTLRAGYSVKTYEELNDSRLILIAVPYRAVRQTVDDLVRSMISWAGKTAVVCGPQSDSAELEQLASEGAAIASLERITAAEGTWFVAEGHPVAIRQIRQLVGRRGTRFLSLQPAKKPLYGAGITFATTLVAPLVKASFECLRAAGLRRLDASLVIAALVERSVKTYLKAGNKLSPSAGISAIDLARQSLTLARLDPLLSEYLEHNCRYAARLLKPHAGD